MILVTGASGFAGGNLVRALLEENRQVRVMVRRDRKAVEGLPVEQVEGDVENLDSLLNACAGVDVVYHLAASISLESSNWNEVEKINVIGTRNVVKACLRSKVRRLIHFSSIHALDQFPLDRPVDENNPPATSPDYPPYDRSKAASEREVRFGLARGLDAVILNPTALVGPYDFKPSYFGQAILLLARGLVPGLVDGGFDWVDVRDVVSAAIIAERIAPSGTSYLLGGHWHSVREVAQMTASLTGRRAPGWIVPMKLAYILAPLMYAFAKIASQRPIYTRVTLRALQGNRQISHARAERELGYNPRPFIDTLTDTLNWFRNNGRLR